MGVVPVLAPAISIFMNLVSALMHKGGGIVRAPRRALYPW